MQVLSNVDSRGQGARDGDRATTPVQGARESASRPLLDRSNAAVPDSPSPVGRAGPSVRTVALPAASEGAEAEGAGARQGAGLGSSLGSDRSKTLRELLQGSADELLELGD